MIKIEHVETAGWEAAFRGMRNPMNSWPKNDSEFGVDFKPDGTYQHCEIGPNDRTLSTNLRNAGVEHRKYMRDIIIWCDVTAPLYWWKQYATYKIGTVENSCSTMHKIHAKEFTVDDFACEDMSEEGYDLLDYSINVLNSSREKYLETEDKKYWNTMVKMLPDSYLQKRTCMLNYEVAAKQYRERRHHKLQEWHDWCDFLKTLPASELIVGEE